MKHNVPIVDARHNNSQRGAVCMLAVRSDTRIDARTHIGDWKRQNHMQCKTAPHQKDTQEPKHADTAGAEWTYQMSNKHKRTNKQKHNRILQTRI